MRIKQYINKKDGKKYYMFQLYLGRDPITDKERRTTRRGFKTKREAELALAKLKTEADEYGIQYSVDTTTFKQVFDLWYEGYKHSVKESSLIANQSLFKDILNTFGKFPVKKITIPLCQKILSKWNEKYTNYKKIVGYACNVFDYAIHMELIKTNPMKHTIKPKLKKKEVNEEDLYYTRDELRQLFIYLKEEDYKIQILFRLLAFTGARKSEILALTWSDIDFDTNTLDINKTLSRTQYNGVESNSTKTTTSNRKISLDKTTLTMLKKWKIKQPINKNNLLFAGENTYIYRELPNRILKNVCEKHNFKQIKIHGFRHTHCSLCFEAGFSPQEVQYRLGHADIKTTMKIYSHFTETQREKSAEKFANYVNF